MLSKSKGQVLRVAAALHVLFHVKYADSTIGTENVPTEVVILIV